MALADDALHIVSTAVWITLRCPVPVVGHKSGIQLMRYRWFFGRFTPEADWYSLL